MNNRLTYSRIDVLGTQVLHARDISKDRPIAIGPRLVRLSENQLACTFMLQQALGKNDFMPVICHSDDLGQLWSSPQLLWKDHTWRDSIFGAVSPRRDAQGRLIFYGLTCHVDQQGESNWHGENHGLKQNELFFATSSDDGNKWSRPQPIAKPTPGSVEAPGPVCVMTCGRWIASYSVYNTFDRHLKTPHHQLWAVYSDDEGKSWQSSCMMSHQPQDNTAESWVIQLSDGRLLGSCWHSRQEDGKDYPTPMVLSDDRGHSWSPPQTVGIQGQSIALAAMPDGGALMVYNQRRQQPSGVRLAMLQPDENGRINLVHDQLIWQATSAGQKNAGDQSLSNWQDFAFGEPSILMLDDHHAMVVLWCAQPEFHGIIQVNLSLN